MQRQGTGWWWVVGILGMFAASAASACTTCAPDMYCVDAPRGAVFCVGNGWSCSLAGRCFLGGGGPVYDGGAAVVQVTLLDGAPGSLTPGFGAGRGPRVEHGAGMLVGRAAARLVRAGGLEPHVLWTGTGQGEGVTAAFRTPLGDGFTLRREAAGRGAHVVVRALTAGRPGAVLADAPLEEDDALIVPVSFEGRPRMLVLQAPTLPREEARLRQQRLQRDFDADRAGRAPNERPPFEVSVVEE